MTGTVTTWLDGRAQTVPADDPRLLEQEETRKLWMHCANMRRLPLHGRQEYLANVGRRGIGWQRRLRRSGRRGSLTWELSGRRRYSGGYPLERRVSPPQPKRADVTVQIVLA